jgi:uncharacterized phiE125 gp8 family phage protein
MLITKEDVKKYLNYDVDENDPLIDSLIEMVERDVKELMNGTVFDAGATYQTYTEYYDGDDSNQLMLRHYPVRAITTVHINSDTPRAYGASALIASSNYILDGDNGMLTLDGNIFTEGVQTVKVVYTAGWKTTDAPADLKLAIINKVVALLLEAIGGVNAVEQADFVYRPDKLRKVANEILARYEFIR